MQFQLNGEGLVTHESREEEMQRRAVQKWPEAKDPARAHDKQSSVVQMDGEATGAHGTLKSYDYPSSSECVCTKEPSDSSLLSHVTRPQEEKLAREQCRYSVQGEHCALF